jgi:SET domain-containing protein
MSLKNKIIKQINSEFVVKLAPSKINNAGVGVFALTKIPEKSVVFQSFSNHFIKWKQIKNAPQNVVEHLKSICNNNEEGFWLDCELNSVYAGYYINHSDNPNLKHDRVNDIYIALREIQIGEELTCAYDVDEIDWR